MMNGNGMNLVGAVAQIEEKIRTLCLQRRLRIQEFFLDYDQLRSGFVTRGQFIRVLAENLQLTLRPEEEDIICRFYDLKQDGRTFNWKLFGESIERNFDPGDVSRDPAFQKVEPKEYLGTGITLRPLSPGSEAQLEILLKKIVHFYKIHGINLRASFQDSDVHNLGKVTESQFYRTLPKTSEMTEEDVHLLVKKYRHVTSPGEVVYLNLHNDLIAMEQQIKLGTTFSRDTTDLSSYLVPQPGAEKSVQEILDKLRVAVHKNGVRTTQFFKDYDRLNHGVITENQFLAALKLAVGKESQIDEQSALKVAQFYRVPGSAKINYRSFCDYMENAFSHPNLEKQPEISPSRPGRGALGRKHHDPGLSDADNKRANELLEYLHKTVREKRIMLYQYFKDFDRSNAYSRVMTPSQFSRVLSFLDLKIGPDDVALLTKRFSDPTTGDVNYPDFVQAIDELFNNTTLGPSEHEHRRPLEHRTRAADALQMMSSGGPVVGDTGSVDLNDLLARIRHIVLTKRVRIQDFFEDFDQLRSQSMTKNQFRRCLAQIGLSKLGEHDISEAQFALLCRVYEDPVDSLKVIWTKFANDIDSVFTIPNLEKTPTSTVPSQELFNVPKPGTMDWRFAGDDHTALYDQALARLRQRAAQRRILARPVFTDFDKHKNGHITRKQFRQALTMLDIFAEEAELAAIEGRFNDDLGFNYREFLNDFQPEPEQKHMYPQRLKDIQEANAAKHSQSDKPSTLVSTDLEGILLKMKTKVLKERIRMIDFCKDYDKLNSGRVLMTQFRRALDLCRFSLTESEIALLEDRYRAIGHPDAVDYVRLSDEMESVFTRKNLEKLPLAPVQQFKPAVDWQQNALTSESETNIFREVMQRIADKVRQHRMQLFPIFEDFDPVHSGHVTMNQFRRVLTELELNSRISDLDFSTLCRAFGEHFGGRDDVNYIGFCHMLYELAGIDPLMP